MMRPFIGITLNHLEESYTLKQAYFLAVYEAGGQPVGIAPVGGDDQADSLVARLDGLLLSGGSDVCPSLYGEEKHDKTDGIQADVDRSEIALVKAFYAAKKPILGICRGMQISAVALGGSLTQHVPDLPGIKNDHQNKDTTHTVLIEDNSSLFSIYQSKSVVVNSTHHQAVKRPPDGFSVTAYSDDGVPEAIEGGSIIAVQWHPEKRIKEGHLPIFINLIDRCRKK